MGGDDALYPIAVLIDELKNDDVQVRLNAVGQLRSIGVALGPERTREELIPYLSEDLDEDDEVLLHFAEQLGNMVDLVGGAREAHCLLEPLESLAAIEDNGVREKAAESIKKVAEAITDGSLNKHLLPMAIRLAENEWLTTKATFSLIVPVCYKRVGSADRKKLMEHYGTMCKHDTPMVRRAAVSAMSEMCLCAEQSVLVDDLLPLLDYLSEDDQDSVRLLSVQTIGAVMEKVSADVRTSKLLPIVRRTASDSSWRVRYMVADEICNLSKGVDIGVVIKDLLPAYVGLLKDNEAEVRTAAANRIDSVGELVGKDAAVRAILPVLKDESLTQDSSQHVRAALAGALMGLPKVFEKDITVEVLVPIFVSLLKDEFSDVRLNIISRLDKLSGVIGPDMLANALLPAILELAEDKKWRVRKAMIEHMPLLAKQLKREIFDNQLGDLSLSWLGDCVYAIREAATENLKAITEILGAKWAKSKIVPHIQTLHIHENYLLRMTTLFTINVIAPVVGEKIVQEDLLEIALSSARDSVPNIRFNASKTLGKLIPFLPNSVVQGDVKRCLETLKNDADRDVQFFAKQSLDLL